MQAKISNFDLSHKFNVISQPIDNIDDRINWSAPEELKCISKNSILQEDFIYTTQCEIFSLGMLLWELDFQRKPYEEMTMMEILKHVSNGGRETLDTESCSNSIQKGYYSIIKLAWDQAPSLRPVVQHIFNMLQKLYDKHIVQDINFIDNVFRESLV
ncbi:hypothetical protein C1645_776035 [Glomus cerebriforme]|uniref:Protein kinase domain-containing protein n=1 Tax=Glomus cerebriforme TaxID=658196 RepID=A0A397SYM0_9GLOM|nr:hypothetical protein C1645_776035 [Glomus cerebriforme]